MAPKDPGTASDLADVLKGAAVFFAACLFFAGVTGLYVFSWRHPLSIESYIEWAQEIILALACAAAFSLYKHEPEAVKGGYLLMAGFFTAMLIREFDQYFDVLSHGSWVYAEAAVLVPLLVCVWRLGFKSALGGLADIARSKTFVVLALSLALVLVYSRLFGSSHFWAAILGERAGAYYDMKRVVEEAAEFEGYIFLFASVAVLWFEKLVLNRRKDR